MLWKILYLMDNLLNWKWCVPSTPTPQRAPSNGHYWLVAGRYSICPSHSAIHFNRLITLAIVIFYFHLTQSSKWESVPFGLPRLSARLELKTALLCVGPLLPFVAAPSLMANCYQILKTSIDFRPLLCAICSASVTKTSWLLRAKHAVSLSWPE